MPYLLNEHISRSLQKKTRSVSDYQSPSLLGLVNQLAGNGTNCNSSNCLSDKVFINDSYYGANYDLKTKRHQNITISFTIGSTGKYSNPESFAKKDKGLKLLVIDFCFSLLI